MLKSQSDIYLHDLADRLYSAEHIINQLQIMYVNDEIVSTRVKILNICLTNIFDATKSLAEDIQTKKRSS